MARALSVYRTADVVIDSKDVWHVCGVSEPIYEQPLGSESAVREDWSAPAAEMGLSLLAAIYEHGFYHGIRWTGEELDAVTEELGQLEAYWSASNLPAERIADLRERAGYLREGLATAKKCGGVLVIS